MAPRAELTDALRPPAGPEARRAARRRALRRSPRSRSPRSRPRSPRRKFWRRRLLLLVLVLAVPVGWSYGHALTAPGGAGLGPGVRTVEWLRGHGGASVVGWTEELWYSWHQPAVGGRPGAGLIPSARGAAVAPRRAARSVHSTPRRGPLPAPAPMASIARPALAGEGVWHGLGRPVDGVPAMYAAFLRPDAVHTSLVTGIVWMDPKVLSFQLFAGGQEPGGAPWPLMAPVPVRLRPRLVAAFNSGFRLQDAGGGYYADGRTAKPLVPGAASLVFYRNGTATVAKWDRDVAMGPDVSAVRQNLSLIVDAGRPVEGLQSGPVLSWGATVGGKVLVWRSGIGVTADGALVYAAGDGLSAYSLADVLVHAGALRAMELDINSTWVNFFSFSYPPGQAAAPANGRRLLPGMMRPPQRYFEGTARDFVVALAR